MGLSLFLMNWPINIINLTLFQWVSCCSPLTCFPSNRFHIYLSLNLFGFIPFNFISKSPSHQKKKERRISAWKYWLNLKVIMTWKKPISCPSLQSRLVRFQLPAGRACLHGIRATTEWFDWGWNNREGFFVCCRFFFSSDILLDDSYEGNLRKEGRSVRIVVNISRGPKTTKVSENFCPPAFCAEWISSGVGVNVAMISSTTQATQCHEYLIGSIGVSGKTKWDVLDGVIRRLFKVKRERDSNCLCFFTRVTRTCHVACCHVVNVPFDLFD